MKSTHPLITDYKDAILRPDNFNALKTLEPCRIADSHYSIGESAVVFKMKNTQKNTVALKCYEKSIPILARSYKNISKYLKSIKNPYFVNCIYANNELTVKDKVFSILCMPWIEGPTLAEKVKELCETKKKNELYDLAVKFDKLGLFLIDQDFAHGDLTPNNIIINKKNELMLVDYDTMFVPELKSIHSPSAGSPEYQHPHRTTQDFNRFIDDFSILVISLSLHALSQRPSLYNSERTDGGLLFRAKDFRNLLACPFMSFFKEYEEDEILHTRFSLLVASASQPEVYIHDVDRLLEKTTGIVRKRKHNEVIAGEEERSHKRLQMPDGNQAELQAEPQIQSQSQSQANPMAQVRPQATADKAHANVNLDTTQKQEMTHLEFEESASTQKPTEFDESGNYTGYNKYVDPQGVAYSEDKKTLIKKNDNITEYTIPKGTEIICDLAFAGTTKLTSISIPSTVVEIGENVFKDCVELKNINIVGGKFHFIGGILYNKDKTKIILSLPHLIGAQVILPETLTSIADHTFENCKDLMKVAIPKTVTAVGNAAFENCTALQTIKLPENITHIKARAFKGCTSLSNIQLPHLVKNIEEEAFARCTSLQNILLPNATVIGVKAFSQCTALKEISLPAVKSIENNAFELCSILESVKLSNSLTYIGDRAFSECRELVNIKLPDSLSYIGKHAFYWCRSIIEMTIPDSITSIERWTFEGCESLRNIVLPDSLSNIGAGTFYECFALSTIKLPPTVETIGNEAFTGCPFSNSFKEQLAQKFRPGIL